MYPMELQGDRQEITLRLLQNGKYVWTIIVNSSSTITDNTIEHLKQLDKKLQDAFPNHVKPSSIGFKEFEE